MQSFCPSSARCIALPVLFLSLLGCGDKRVRLAPANITAEPTGLDFGAVKMGASATRELLLSNTRTGVLHLGEISVVEDGREAFWVGPYPERLAAGEQVWVEIRYVARDDLGVDHAWLAIPSDADNAAELRVALTGETIGACPEGQLECADGCVDPMNNPSHCGACGNECTHEQACGAGQCVCVPLTCAELGNNCGQVEDGCGGILDCGASCPVPQTCGGGGVANVCGCTPLSCEAQGKNCGQVEDGCGGTLDCGASCPAPQTCGGGGEPNLCGCTAEPDAAFCARLGLGCGNAVGIDNCGGARTAHCGVCGTCSAPEVIHPQGGVYSGTTAGSSLLGGNCGGGSAPEKLYRWTPAVSGRATISTCGSSFDTVVNVLNGSCSGAAVACNNDSSVWCYNSTTHSLVTFQAIAGTTYFISVDGAGTAAGKFALKVVSPEGTCASPFFIPPEGGATRFTMNGPNLGDSGSCGGQGSNRVHRWRPNRSGTASIVAKPDFWPAVLYVRSGSCHGPSLACQLQSAQWPTNSVSLPVTANTDYFIWMAHGSYDEDSVMQYELTVHAPP